MKSAYTIRKEVDGCQGTTAEHNACAPSLCDSPRLCTRPLFTCGHKLTAHRRQPIRAMPMWGGGTFCRRREEQSSPD